MIPLDLENMIGHSYLYDGVRVAIASIIDKNDYALLITDKGKKLHIDYSDLKSELKYFSHKEKWDMATYLKEKFSKQYPSVAAKSNLPIPIKTSSPENIQKKDIMETNEKKCTKCGFIKSITDFSKNASNPDGLQYYCKECVKKDNVKRYQNKSTEPKSIDRKPIQVVKSENDKIASSHQSFKTLKDYTPEQLMKELYLRGYEGILTYTAKIDISTLK